MKRVNVQFFAILREQAGTSHLDVETSAATASGLFRELTGIHGFSLDEKQLKVAINDEFAGWETALADGDQVVFIPPVAGG